ncbi:MAG: agmatinase [Alphaproteobacteria bacterium]|nr:MAG: agmatinase [Alphaproteobacteria bacterium]TAF76694.1 MAG: agmatinase [Alphaproteobacteria bacterium]
MDILPSRQGFLKLPPEDAVGYEDARAVIVPFGLEASVSYGGGTSRGPQAMIDASPELELFDETLWCEPYRYLNLVTLPPLKRLETIAQTLDAAEAVIEQLLVDGKFPMTFGGEHSITAGTIRPFARRYPDLAILHFDAHADLRDGYMGEHYSHAAALRRCIDDDKVQGRGEHLTLVSCGIRNISASEIPFYEANKHRIHIYWGKDMASWNVREIVEHLRGRHVYLTFDVDGLDASLMSATGTPEPGGLFWADAMAIIRAASEVCTIVGADVNELAPIDGFHCYDFLAAKLAYKIMSYALYSSPTHDA